MNHNLIRFYDNKHCQCTLAYFFFSQKMFTLEITSFLKLNIKTHPFQQWYILPSET